VATFKRVLLFLSENTMSPSRILRSEFSMFLATDVGLLVVLHYRLRYVEANHLTTMPAQQLERMTMIRCNNTPNGEKSIFQTATRHRLPKRKILVSRFSLCRKLQLIVVVHLHLLASTTSPPWSLPRHLHVHARLQRSVIRLSGISLTTKSEVNA
jgi:hypothetical protein